ncbi:MAG: hypothetical protein MUE54_15545, partial [Anaerolineae bacterium]|nr:hypothetical protein [Anaerolineae bacterium]
MTTQAGITPIPKIRTQSEFQKRVQESLAGYAFMFPAMLIFFVFLIIPIGFALFISLTDWNGITPLGQQAQAATGTVQFTNQTDQEITIPPDTVVRGVSEREVIEFTMSDVFTLQAGETITTNITLTDQEQGALLTELSNLQTVVPRNLRSTFEVTNPVADEVGGYAVSITNITDAPATTPDDGLTISTVGNLS